MVRSSWTRWWGPGLGKNLSFWETFGNFFLFPERNRKKYFFRGWEKWERNEKFLNISQKERNGKKREISLYFFLCDVLSFLTFFDLHTNHLVTRRVPCFSSKVFMILVFRRKSDKICFSSKLFLFFILGHCNIFTLILIIISWPLCQRWNHDPYFNINILNLFHITSIIPIPNSHYTIISYDS